MKRLRDLTKKSRNKNTLHLEIGDMIPVHCAIRPGRDDLTLYVEVPEQHQTHEYRMPVQEWQKILLSAGYALVPVLVLGEGREDD